MQRGDKVVAGRKKKDALFDGVSADFWEGRCSLVRPDGCSPGGSRRGGDGRTGRMQRQYELLKEQESAAAAALREAEAQMMEEKIPEEDGERQAEAADLQEELHNIRLQERVLEARILETGG